MSTNLHIGGEDHVISPQDLEAHLDAFIKRELKGIARLLILPPDITRLNSRAGEITGFTGVDDPYETPAKPDLRLETAANSVDQCVEQILNTLDELGVDIERTRPPSEEE